MRRTIHTGRRAAASVAAALTAALLAAACGGSDDGPIVAQGRVVAGDGAAVSGARVTLVVWPPEADEAEVGESFTLPTVAEATTADDGRFELRIDESALDDLPSDPAAIVDFEIQANAPEGFMSYMWSARPAASTAPGTFVRADADPLDVSPTPEPVTVDLNVTDRTYDDGQS